MTARWGCMIIGFFLAALIILMLVWVRISGVPLSQDTSHDAAVLADGDG